MPSISSFNTIVPGSIAEIDSVAAGSILKINALDYTTPDVMTNSLTFDSETETYFNLTTAASGYDDEEFIISVWVKRTSIDQGILCMAGPDTTDYTILYFDSSYQLAWKQVESSVTTQDLTSVAIYRDCSQWYHIVASYDSAQGASIDRIKMWVNGSQITLTENTPVPGNDKAFWNANSKAHKLGVLHLSNTPFDGYMADFIAIDGLSIQQSDFAITDFGQFEDGVWKPKAFSGPYGDGWHLDFEDSGDLGNDISGNDHHFTPNNFVAGDQVVDKPENNYCTLDINSTRANISVLAEGGLSPRDAAAAWHTSCGTFLMKTGKWYFELDAGADDASLMPGVLAVDEHGGAIIDADQHVGQVLRGYGLLMNGAGNPFTIYNNNVGVNDDNLPAPAANDILMVAFDADAGKVWFGVDGTWGDFGATGVGDPANGTNPCYTISNPELYDFVPAVSVYAHETALVNFGQRTFAHTPPTGFLALCADNIDEPTVVQPDAEAFTAKLYEGSGVQKSVTGIGFQPDFVWIKNRDQADQHMVFDSVRGAENYLSTDGTDVEANDNESLQSFDADGFTIGENLAVNTNTENYVSFCEKKGASYGLDVVEYEGTGAAHTESHGLGVVPEMIWVKSTDAAYVWLSYHRFMDKANPADYYLVPSLGNARADDATIWNDTVPTNSVFSVGSHVAVNENLKNFVAFLWASIPGFSKAFYYVSNANVDGPYVYCGFRPRFLIIKAPTSGYSWFILDTARNTVNTVDAYLLVDLPNAEVNPSTYDIDVCANGFKVRVATAGINAGVAPHIGMAFADQPFKYSNAK